MSTTSRSSQWYSGFDPRYIPNCTLWLDANDPSTITKANGTNISSWRDKSSGSFNATNSSSTGPTTITSGNLTYLSFNGSSNFLVTTLTVNASMHTIMIVYKPNANNASSNSLLRAQATLGYIVFPYYTGTKNAYISNFDGSGAGSLDNPNSNLDPAASTTSHNVVSITIASGDQAIFNNGVSKATNNKTITSTTSDPFYIGAFGGTSQYYSGQLAEVIIYNRTLTSTERQQLEGYLAWKWGLQSNLNFTSPLNIPNTVLWLDASDSSTVSASGGQVTQWNDKSGNGMNTISYVGSRPTYTATQNGKNVISFASNLGQQLEITPRTSLPYGTGGFSAFVVGRSDSRVGVSFQYQTPLTWGDRSTTSGSFEVSTETSGSTVTLLQQYFGAATVARDNTNINNNYFIFSHTATSASSSLPYRNGNIFSTPYASAPSYNILQSGGVGLIGSSNGSTNFFNGTIGEIIVYNRQLTTNERQLIETYLSSKWNISVATTVTAHPYISRNPNLSMLSPTDFSNCAFWLDAADRYELKSLTVNSSNIVTAWKDKASNNAAGVSGSPVYSTTGLNSRPSVGITLTNRFFFDPISNPASTQNLTFFGVANLTASTSYGRLISCSNTSDGTTNNDFGLDRNLAVANVPTETQIGLYRNGVTVSTTSPAIALNTAFITGGVCNFSAGTNTLYINGVAQPTPGTTTGTFTFNRIGIGANVNTKVNTGSDSWIGNISEIIIYYTNLSDTQRQVVEGYLAWKWGLQANLPSTHPFKNFYPMKIN